MESNASTRNFHKARRLATNAFLLAAGSANLHQANVASALDCNACGRPIPIGDPHILTVCGQFGNFAFRLQVPIGLI
jgi:hypothetical protein